MQIPGQVYVQINSVVIDAAFFKAHPEFSGDVRVTVLADGQALLSAKRVDAIVLGKRNPTW